MKALGFDFDKELDRELFETYKLSPEERQTVYVSFLMLLLFQGTDFLRI